MREEFIDPLATRPVDPRPIDDGDQVDDVGLRPKRLSEFVGQRELKEHLTIVLEAAASTESM